MLIWNCIGESSKHFYGYFNEYIKNNNPTLIVVMEVICDSYKLIKTFLRMGFNENIIVENKGSHDRASY